MQNEDYWQTLHPPGTFQPGVVDKGYAVELTDGRQFFLPIRPRPDNQHALASLIINQASFLVQEALAEDLAERLAPYKPDVVVGLPTLGLTLASAVARKLGHSRYVPLGTSAKFWYREDLSVPLSSITTPQQAKRLYVDPRMLPLLHDRRVALIDDVISSGTSIAAGLSLMAAIEVYPVVVGAAMLQSQRWRVRLQDIDVGWPQKIVSVFSTPLLAKDQTERWVPTQG